MANELRKVKKGDIIFGEGSYEHVMYEIYSGAIGIYKDYGKATEVRLAQLTEGYFGEMGLITDEGRTATAVALADSTILPISEDTMESYYTENTDKVYNLLSTISSRVRNMDQLFMDACECIDECVKAEENNEKVSESVIKRMKEIVNV